MSNIYRAQGVTLLEQYRDVGLLFAKTIQQSVQKIAKSRMRASKIRRIVAERTWNNLKDKSESSEFVECFKSWCLGAQITPEQGMWLMADNLSGCQTMVVRYASGVALLHTEEEFRDENHIELHMTSPHTISFQENGERFNSLVYNNLMPGAGLYGWQRDKIVAVDSIFLREHGIEEVDTPLLANIVSWMVWRMKPSEASAERIINLVHELGTLVDGYVINVVRKHDQGTEGYKVILARDEAKIIRLGYENGSYLKQVNIVDSSEVIMKWTLPPRNIWRGGYKYFMGRLNTLKSHAREYAKYTQYGLSDENLYRTHAKIQSMIFKTLASDYVNDDLGAICVGFVDEKIGTSVSSKLNDGREVEVVEYIDWIKM